MLIDTPTSGGGNTNTGGIAEKFLQPQHREAICSIISNADDMENFEILSQNLNIMITIIHSILEDIDTDKLKHLGIEIMSFVRTKFLDTNQEPWIPINPSLHSMCAHSWQLFMICSGPIVQYSEQAQEHWNKFVTKFKSGHGARARQHGVSVNIEDVFTRMLVVSHPTVADKQRKIVCSSCHQIGHSARSKVQHVGSYGPLTKEQSLINKYYLN